MNRTLLPLVILTAILLSGCSSIYYNIQEKLGNDKREIMVDRVENARDAQEDAGEQFQTAFEKFKELTNFDGGDLEKRYNSLKSEFDRSEARANKVSERIASVEDVSRALFREWENELGEYKSDSLRRSSERTLRETQRNYEQLISAMHRAEDKMPPVLDAFRDQVLYLKHNLNAQAIASLDGDTASIEREVESLIEEMRASIAEADAFIDRMESNR